MAKILVVEDNSANMELIAVVLEIAGHTVLQAWRAVDGLAIGRSELPDLVLMDIQLPGMNGLDATAIFKADPVTAQIPVIALTAFAMKGDETRFRAAGFDDYVAKPFDYRNLLAVVERHLEPPAQCDDARE